MTNCKENDGEILTMEQQRDIALQALRACYNGVLVDPDNVRQIIIQTTERLRKARTPESQQEQEWRHPLLDF